MFLRNNFIILFICVCLGGMILSPCFCYAEGSEIKQTQTFLQYDEDIDAQKSVINTKSVVFKMFFSLVLILAMIAISMLVLKKVVNTPYGNFRGRDIVKVIDNGPGVRPEIEKSLFNPFITTRPEGTGLGLAIVYRMAKQHQWTLKYQRDLNLTCFSLNISEYREVIP